MNRKSRHFVRKSEVVMGPSESSPQRKQGNLSHKIAICSIPLIALRAVLILASPLAAHALEPADVFVISNKNLPDSQRVAEHYLAIRSVPQKNHIALDLPVVEDISRSDYQAKLLQPLREALAERRNEVKVLLTAYGVPLRVGPKVLTTEEQAEEARLKEELKALDADNEPEKRIPLTIRLQKLTAAESTASVDSELMLLWWPDYPLARWVINPLYFPLPDEYRRQLPPVMMTARLDGPSPDVALRLIDDAVAAEARGLKGKAYFDARGIRFDPKKPGETGTGYEGYDESFREAADLLKRGGLEVTLDDRPELFPPESCPDCAVYAGWYRLGNYIPTCTFAQGAVAWHLASSEAVTLRDPNSKLWCPNLLKDGAAVTIGPVAEPYTVGFPKPAEFFSFLATGKYTVVECYAKTVLFASWMGVLVGDPLYNPFAKTPRIKEEVIPTSPKGIGIQLIKGAGK
jgi:uncharacterized protein (TIGR03790 family)